MVAKKKNEEEFVEVDSSGDVKEVEDEVKHEAKHLSLALKLAKAIGDIKAVAKDGQNNFQNYSFQSEAAIKLAVKQVETKYGFVIIPSYEVIQQYDRKTAKGQLMHFVDVMGTYVITDGVETITGSNPGTGSDSGDKATAKACTSAQKYFFKQLFNISDKEEDPDAADSSPDSGYIEQEQGQPQSQTSPAQQAYNTAILGKARSLGVQSQAVHSKVLKLAGISPTKHLTDYDYTTLTTWVAKVTHV